MIKQRTPILNLLTALFMLVAFAGASPAATFLFFGACAAGDCDGLGTASLSLTEDYVPGTAINSGHLLGFAYGGTNLLNPFVITQDNLDAIEGAMPAVLPSTADFTISGFEGSRFVFFQSSADGSWRAGEDVSQLTDSDRGTESIWTQEVQAVPEPGTFLLMGGGVGLLALRRWKFRT